MIRTLLLIAFVFATALQAQAQSCVDVFTPAAQNPLRISAQGLFNRDESARIQRALTSPKKGRERWTEAVNIYLDARVRMFPLEHREALRRQLSDFRPRFSNRDYEIQATSKKMVYPEHYIDTPLPYVLMVHEWEHLIRSYARSGGRSRDAGGLNYKFNPIEMYREEGAAIWAEWELASHISPKEADDLVTLARGLSKQKKFISMVQTMLASRELGRAQYLTAVRDGGRYSIGNVIQKTATTASLTTLGLGYLGGFVGGCWWAISALVH